MAAKVELHITAMGDPFAGLDRTTEDEPFVGVGVGHSFRVEPYQELSYLEEQFHFEVNRRDFNNSAVGDIHQQEPSTEELLEDKATSSPEQKNLAIEVAPTTAASLEVVAAVAIQIPLPKDETF